MGLQNTADTLEAGLGLTAYVHATDLDTGAEVGLREDSPVVSASVFKIPVLVEACAQAAAGELDPHSRIDLETKDFAVRGPTGISVFSDPVSLSIQDLCLSMMSVSDNRATDVVMDIVGMDRINARMAALDLPGTVLEGDCAHLFATIDEDLAAQDLPTPASFADDSGALLRTRALDPARTNRTTPRETTRLLGMLWRDDDLAPEACAAARRVLGLQVWSHRLRSGFPDDTVKTSGKTGTLPYVRNEVGVVEHQDSGRYPVAVFLRVPTPATTAPDLDRAIGTLAAAAVDDLRSTRVQPQREP